MIGGHRTSRRIRPLRNKCCGWASHSHFRSSCVLSTQRQAPRTTRRRECPATRNGCLAPSRPTGSKWDWFPSEILARNSQPIPDPCRSIQSPSMGRHSIQDFDPRRIPWVPRSVRPLRQLTKDFRRIRLWTTLVFPGAIKRQLHRQSMRNPHLSTHRLLLPRTPSQSTDRRDSSPSSRTKSTRTSRTRRHSPHTVRAASLLSRERN